MKSIDQQTLLSQLETRIEAHLALARNEFLPADVSTLLRPSDTGGWSIAQCLEHLNAYGRYYLPAIQNRLPKPGNSKTAKVFRSSWFGAYFTRMMEPTTGTRKIKAMKAYIPPVQLDAHAVVRDFITQQETLLALLRQSSQCDLNRIRIPISIAQFIRLKLGDVFQFLIAHNERHLQQAKRVGKELAKG
jgi:hypothetical protein